MKEIEDFNETNLQENSLLKLRPHLVNEWDFEKNDELELDLYQISKGSEKVTWWICPKCESSYDMKINRKNTDRGCPYCAGKRVNHTNSLASLRPELALRWHPTKNGELTPNNITCGSSKTVWWKDMCGHSYRMRVSSIIRGASCHYCSGHKVLKGFNDMWTTNPELASMLLNPEDGYKYMGKSGVPLKWLCNNCDSIFLKSPITKNKCPYCKGRRVNNTNSLSSLRPDLAKEWHNELNGNLTPNDVTSGSGKMVWWLGECGHEWESLISSRNRGIGCPICNNKQVLIGFNDMWTTNTEIAKLLLNKEDGYKYTQHSNKKVDWECSYCRTILTKKSIAAVNKNGLNCPVCSDGFSFAEKIMYNILVKLNEEFEWHKSFIWSDRKAYDFYLTNYDVIIETHGKQHFEESTRGRSLKEEQENDKYKYQMAKENNIQYYVVIDCRHSEFNFIKNNIMNSILNEMFDLSDIDWDEILILSSNSMKLEVLNLWNLEDKNAREIELELKINCHTIQNYLKDFTDIGMCDLEKYKIFIYQINRELEIEKTWDSIDIIKFNKEFFSSVYMFNKMVNSEKIHNGFYWIRGTKQEIEGKLLILRGGLGE